MEKSNIQKQRLLQPSIDYSTNSDVKDDMVQNVKLSKRNSEKDVRLRTIESHLPLKKVLLKINGF